MLELLKAMKSSVLGSGEEFRDSDAGHSNDFKYDSFIKLNSYTDQSTVCIVPTRGQIDARVVNAWFRMIAPLNQPFLRLFVSGAEVADAYNTSILGVLNHPQMSRYKYLLTMEDDNIPPPDGFMKLMRTMLEAEKKGEELWAVSGLYWTKGEEGVPIAFGDVRRGAYNLDFIEFNPEGVTPCCSIPQGFTLYRMDLFRKMQYPWFRTYQEFDPSEPTFNQLKFATQDSWFFRNCYEAGLRFGVRADVRVGHLDIATGRVW